MSGWRICTAAIRNAEENEAWQRRSGFSGTDPTYGSKRIWRRNRPELWVADGSFRRLYVRLLDTSFDELRVEITLADALGEFEVGVVWIAFFAKADHENNAQLLLA